MLTLIYAYMRHILLLVVFFSITMHSARSEPTDNSTLLKSQWYKPLEYSWALQQIAPAKRKEVSTPWRTLITDGTAKNLNLNWEMLSGKSQWNTAILQLSHSPNEKPFYEQRFSKVSQLATLPILPLGGYWLNVKTFDEGLLSYKNFYLNVMESPSADRKDLPQTDITGLQLSSNNKTLTVSGFTGFLKAGMLQVTLSDVTGNMIRREEISLKTSNSDELIISIPEAAPGKTIVIRVDNIVDENVKDRAELWIANIGDFPSVPKWHQSPPTKSVFNYLTGETVATSAPFGTQEAGLKVQIGSMPLRGTETIQLWIEWGQIDPLGGSRDWSNLDAYVSFLTSYKVPFVLAGSGSVLFGNGPEKTWSEWGLNDRGEFKLWRQSPVTSPSSSTYIEGARDFTRSMIKRYRGNPYLVGYAFMSQGMDSGIFQDQHDSVMDYSVSARTEFQLYLKNKYDDINKLNNVWNKHWTQWEDVPSPLPIWEDEINLTPAWRDWTEWKLKTYRNVSVDLFEPLVAELDSKRPAMHYTAKTGPFEYLFHDLAVRQWATVDGAGEDSRMGRINNITKNWGLWRQTESHDVPPANKLYMKDMWTASLRNGGDMTRYNLVFNSLASLFETEYPKNIKLQESMEWWSRTAKLRQTLSKTTVSIPETGIFLSWADMLYRKRAWRWYTMSGDRVDMLTRKLNYLPVTWLSEWTPEEAWEGLKLIIAPQDAVIWDSGFLKKLSIFVKNGGRLAVWGKSGQYITTDSSNQFNWTNEIGGRGLIAESMNKKDRQKHGTLEYRGLSYALDPVVSVSKIPEDIESVVDSFGRPIILKWKWGKGEVIWCLTDTIGESERLMGVLLDESKARKEVISSDRRVDAFLLRNHKVTYVVLYRALNYNQKIQDTSVETSVNLYGLKPSGNYLIHPLLPDGKEWSASGDFLKDKGWDTDLTSSEIKVYEIRETN